MRVETPRRSVHVFLLKIVRRKGWLERLRQILETIIEINRLKFASLFDLNYNLFVRRVLKLDLFSNSKEGDKLININHLIIVNVKLLHQILKLHISKHNVQMIERLFEFNL